MVSLPHFLQLVLGTVIALLPIINPPASAPVFLAITEGDDESWRRKQAFRGACYMTGILVVFLIGGSFIMPFFGLSLPGLRIAGGLLICGIAFSMFAPKKDDEEERLRRAEAKAKRDISFSPLAMPMLSGPGSIAVTIGFSSLATSWLDYVAIILGIIIVAVISFLVLSISSRLVSAIGTNFMSGLTKIMAFLLLCIGIQFIVNGVVGVITEPSLIKELRALLHP
jgi:multiple antibiotic resistance protein